MTKWKRKLTTSCPECNDTRYYTYHVNAEPLNPDEVDTIMCELDKLDDCGSAFTSDFLAGINRKLKAQSECWEEA